MVKHYDDYKSAAKGAKGWIIDNQNMTWAMPYHDGAIAVWKANGKWNSAAQAHNDKLIERQAVIKKAWDGMTGKDGMSKEDLKAAWMKVRVAALTNAGFDPIFK